MTDEKILKYSADYPGFLKNKVESGSPPSASSCKELQAT